jgi:hypothetical protein
MQAQTSTGLIDRAGRAARLEEAVYEEIERDENANTQAAIIVVVTSLAAGLGAFAAVGIGGLIFGTIFGLLGWLAYAYMTFLIGTRLLAGPDTHSSWGEVARTVGFASSPRVLLVLGGLPLLGGIITLLVGLWILAATVVALRSALDFSTGRAIATAILGWLVQGILMVLAFVVAG